MYKTTNRNQEQSHKDIINYQLIWTMEFKTFIVHTGTASKFFNDHMSFQLYLKVVKVYLHSIFLTSVNIILGKQDDKIQVCYVIGSFIVWDL